MVHLRSIERIKSPSFVTIPSKWLHNSANLRNASFTSLLYVLFRKHRSQNLSKVWNGVQTRAKCYNSIPSTSSFNLTAGKNAALRAYLTSPQQRGSKIGASEEHPPLQILGEILPSQAVTVFCVWQRWGLTSVWHWILAPVARRTRWGCPACCVAASHASCPTSRGMCAWTDYRGKIWCGKTIAQLFTLIMPTGWEGTGLCPHPPCWG